MKLANLSLIAVLSASILGACGGQNAEAPPPPPPAAAPAPPPPPPPPPPAAETPPAAQATPPAEPEPVKPTINWEGMSHEQRLEYMKTEVMPKAKELFASFDAKKFGDMKCVTCHGDGAKNQSFKMPNPKLPKLSFTDHFKKHMDKKPEITKFMMEKVTPSMASLLGMQPFDPETKKGFGCMGCHVVGP